MQTYSETGQSLSALLEQARRDGQVRIKSADGQTFVLQPESAKRSPLDVESIDLRLSEDEIIEFIHEGRRQF